ADSILPDPGLVPPPPGPQIESLPQQVVGDFNGDASIDVLRENEIWWGVPHPNLLHTVDELGKRYEIDYRADGTFGRTYTPCSGSACDTGGIPTYKVGALV